LPRFSQISCSRKIRPVIRSDGGDAAGQPFFCRSVENDYQYHALQDFKKQPPADSGMAQKTIESSELFGDSQEIVILHDGAAYRLRITSTNKLILTK
jgi:hemin uptake protein HemP